MSFSMISERGSAGLVLSTVGAGGALGFSGSGCLAVTT
jgi:hypothetical protein